MKAAGEAAPVLLFSDHVLQPVLLYWYDVYNIWIFSEVSVCSVILPKGGGGGGGGGEKKKQGTSTFYLEMNILSLCNPLLSHLHYISELNG